MTTAMVEKIHGVVINIPHLNKISSILEKTNNDDDDDDDDDGAIVFCVLCSAFLFLT